MHHKSDRTYYILLGSAYSNLKSLLTDWQGASFLPLLPHEARPTAPREAAMEPTVLAGAHSRWVHDCCWSAAGRLAVSAGFEGMALVRRVPAAGTVTAAAVGQREQLAGGGATEPIVQLRHDERVRACCDLGAASVATASGASVHCWDTTSSAAHQCDAVRSIDLGHLLGEVQSVALASAARSNTGTAILAAGTPPKKHARGQSPGAGPGGAAAAAAGSIALLDSRASSSVAAMLVGHTGTVWRMRHSPYQSHLVCSASADGTMKVWDLRTAQALYTVRGGHRGGVRCCAFVAAAAAAGSSVRTNETCVITGGFDTTIRAHNLGCSDPVASTAGSSSCKAGEASEAAAPSSRLLGRLGGYCFGLDVCGGWLAAGVGNPDYGVRLWGPFESETPPHELGQAQELPGERALAGSYLAHATCHQPLSHAGV